jgi:HTH-type transcriptional regulator / antitoxin HigA
MGWADECECHKPPPKKKVAAKKAGPKGKRSPRGRKGGKLAMADKSTARTMPASYFELVKEFPLIHIRNDAHLDTAGKMIDRLLQEELDKGAEEYLDVLTDLVERYEDGHHPIPDASAADVLRELMTSNRLSQQQLAKQVKISQSTISAVLNGNRSLTREHVITLAKFFHVSSAAFLPG